MFLQFTPKKAIFVKILLFVIDLVLSHKFHFSPHIWKLVLSHSFSYSKKLLFIVDVPASPYFTFTKTSINISRWWRSRKSSQSRSSHFLSFWRSSFFHIPFIVAQFQGVRMTSRNVGQGPFLTSYAINRQPANTLFRIMRKSAGLCVDEVDMQALVSF